MSQPIADSQDQESRIFQYLKDFTNLRETITRNVINSEDYLVLWMGSLPAEALPESLPDEASWIRIHKPIKPTQPIFPDVPPQIASWIDTATLGNPAILPTVYTEIPGNIIGLVLEEETETKAQIDEYLNNQWPELAKTYHEQMIVWERLNQKYRELQKPYQELFGMYNKLKQSPEEYELIIGLGFCQFFWKGHLLSRHILVGQAEIAFDPNDATLSVMASSDGLNLSPETEMIADLEELHALESEKVLVEHLENLENTENPLTEELKLAVKAFTNRLHEQAEFVDQPLPGREVKNTPQILLAPAILFRKRKTKSYQQLFTTILSDIDGNLYPGATSLMSEFLTTEPVQTTTSEPEESVDNPLLDDTLYFPKKYNSEQVKIIQKLSTNNKVLVLGPPGTGKSHTIANLICHILATGNKVLVTAQTKRALEVLHGLLPQDIALLTINLLGSDKKSFSGLERSINTITERLNNKEPDELLAEIEDCREQIHHHKTKKAELENAWIENKKIDWREFELTPNYKGLLRDIANQIFDSTPQFDWFRDAVSALVPQEDITQLKKLHKLSSELGTKDISQIQKKIPDPSKLITVEELSRYKELTRDFQDNEDYEPMETLGDFDLDSIVISSQVYANRLNKVMNLDYPFAKAIFEAEIINKSSHWKRIFEETGKHVSPEIMAQIYYSDCSYQFVYPSDKSLKQLATDVQVLYEYCQKGKSLSSKLQSLLFPKAVKERKYILSEVMVNGRVCDTKEDLALVKNDLAHRLNLQRLNEIWNQEIWNPSTDTLYKGYRDYNHHRENLLAVYHIIYEMKQHLSNLQSVVTLESASLANYDYFIQLGTNLERTNQYRKRKELEAKGEKSLQYLSDEKLHPLAAELLEALEAENTEDYQQARGKIAPLKKALLSYKKYSDLMTAYQDRFPVLTGDIAKGMITGEQIAKISEATEWKVARHAVEEILDVSHQENFEEQIRALEDLAGKGMENLVHLKAWYHLLLNLKQDSSLRQHLTSWMQYVKKIGKTSTSKRSIKFRKLAQEEMTNCRSAIPCWIMPLYKVVDTIKPVKGFFDYIIIDEASQLGPESYFLFYLAKNIIIVGDDKQTSPEYVGVLADQMKPYMQKYLYDVPFKQHFGTDFSLFDFGRILCADTIVLREHFRCMPEIIEFCNQMWYQPNGYSLYPLRQYNENRLEPIVTEFVENGFVEGTRSTIINKNEADRIVQTLIRCLSDPRYEGKTFGVITLQGSAQSKYIEKEILEKVDPLEIENRKIICGISSDFQGDERDVILLSLVTSREHNRAPFTKSEDERRFNVAVSRAKDQLMLFHSVKPEDLTNTDDLRYKLLMYMLNTKDKIFLLDQEDAKPFESKFEQDIYQAIKAKGYTVIPQYKVAQYRIDLVIVLPSGIKIAVECDGDSFHGTEQYKDDMIRQRELERCGWQFFRIRASMFYTSPATSLDPLWEQLEKNEQVQQQ